MATATKAKRSSSPPASKDTHHTLDDFAKSIGLGRYFNAQEWSSLLGREVGSLCLSAVHETRGFNGHNICGYKVADVVAAIRKHGTPHELTEVSVALMEGSPSDCIEPHKQYGSKDAAELLGIDLADIREQFGDYVDGAELLAWGKGSDMRYQLSFRAAAIIVRKREKAKTDEERQRREASRELTTAERLAKIREDRERKQAEEAAEKRGEWFEVYRPLIFRFSDLSPDEMEQLVDVAEKLFNSAAEKSIEHDLAQIARLAELEERRDSSKQREREFNEASAKVDKHKTLLAKIKEEEREFFTAQTRWREARGASAEIIGLRQSNPDLFAINIASDF